MKEGPQMNRPISVHLYAVCTVTLWASGFALTKVALTFFPANAVGLIRYAVASLVLLPLVIYKKLPPPAYKDIPLFLLSGAVGFFFYMIAFNKGLETLTSATSSVLIATAPVLTALLAVLLFKERMKALSWVAVSIEFCGVLVLTLWNGIFSIEAGVIWIIVAALLISIYSFLQRRLTRSYSPLQATAYSIFAGALFLLVFLPEALPLLFHAPLLPLCSVLFMGIFPSAMGYVFWAKALSMAKQTSAVTNYMFLTPFLSTLFGFLMILETPDLPTILGGFIILCGLALFRFGSRSAEKI
jgi:drug/metabolite transporter (DMT)-like permease